MKRLSFYNLGLFAAVFCIAASAFGQKMKPEDVVAKHLDSIGTAEARAGVKTRMGVGEAVVTFVSQKNQSAQGRIVMASAGEKNFIGLSLNATDYPGEKFSYDGSKAKVATVIDGKRSFFGNFVDSNELILKESLMGGTLASSWALANLDTRKAKLSFDGTKKINGKEHYVLGYSPKGGGDLDISLYFDKDTFRHVRTEYKRTSSAPIGRNIDDSARQNESRIKVTEDYSDFKDVKGLTLPHSYKLVYLATGANGTLEVEWAYNLSEFALNRPLDDKTFDADAR